MRICKTVFVLSCIALIFVSTPALAQYDVPHSVMGNGGGPVTDSSNLVYGTLGQSIVDISVDPSLQARHGYWYVVDALHLGPTTAVTFAAVGASLSNEGVVLHWRIAEADGLEGFNIYRSSDDGAGFARMNEVLVLPDQSTFIDSRVRPGRAYGYMVGAVDRDGEAISLVVRITVPLKETALFQNYPNPFNPRTTIAFSLPALEQVDITIYDIRGRRVRQLLREKLPYGKHLAEWNGRNDDNELVGSGVYLYRMTAGKRSYIKKMLLLK